MFLIQWRVEGVGAIVQEESGSFITEHPGSAMKEFLDERAFQRGAKLEVEITAHEVRGGT